MYHYLYLDTVGFGGTFILGIKGIGAVTIWWGSHARYFRKCDFCIKSERSQ